MNGKYSYNLVAYRAKLHVISIQTERQIEKKTANLHTKEKSMRMK